LGVRIPRGVHQTRSSAAVSQGRCRCRAPDCDQTATTSAGTRNPTATTCDHDRPSWFRSCRSVSGVEAADGYGRCAAVRLVDRCRAGVPNASERRIVGSSAVRLGLQPPDQPAGLSVVGEDQQRQSASAPTCWAVCSTSTGQLHERLCAPFRVGAKCETLGTAGSFRLWLRPRHRG
jgi:hypothetical protein